MKFLQTGLLIVVLALSHPVCGQEVNDLDTVRELASAGDWEAALEAADGLIAADPENIQARFFKGLLLLEYGDTVRAQETFTEIARLFPRLPEAFNNLAAIYAMDGEYEKARQALLSAVANAPDYAVARSNLGDLYVKLATDAYRKAAELDPEDPGNAAKLQLLEQMFAAGG